MYKPLYGILGGMGPATSAEFLNEIYANCKGQFASERDYPRMILVSDPLAPDRYQSFTNDNFRVLTQYIENAITNLQVFNVNKIMICCFVAHACLKNIDPALLGNVISLTALLNETVAKLEHKPILLSTSMMYELQLINRDHVIYLNQEHITRVNQYIYKLKTSNNARDFVEFIHLIEELLSRYQTNSVALACSDLHMVNRFIKQNHLKISFDVIDAMDIAAAYILHDKAGVQYA